MDRLAVVAFIVLVGCARATSPVAGTGTASPTQIVSASPNPSDSPRQTPPSPGSRSLTEADSGTTITVRVGQLIEVSLGSEYQRPESNGAAVTRESSAGGYPSGQPLRATFRAVQAGKADLNSGTDYACLHTTPRCGVAQRLWTVHVVVEN